MDLFSIIKPEKLEGYLVRNRVLRDETKLLRVEIELFKSESDSVIRSSLFESVVIRASKLVRNSGFTMKSFREYIRQGCPKKFRRELYSVLDDFEKEEALLANRIVRLKNRRDRVIVHMDPRFAFHPEREAENRVELEDVEAICSHLEKQVVFFSGKPLDDR
ncbi:hypothetical protein [Mesotoga sp. BH458_6_3_2_1]|jgi:hypothetical protein|uniref:hypothetical protein n=1 Tax=Mesotoga sp. BH458_6_3_2_1 TaxID=1437446 RepID=UPI00217CFE48|nr:hypothetical protein [Mesotoga sp. BH458_6_3_2_1]MDD3682184.1 hypothetical protein [Mesotoga sp.]